MLLICEYLRFHCIIGGDGTGDVLKDLGNDFANVNALSWIREQLMEGSLCKYCGSDV
jgi:hypothetical protein